MSWTLATLAEAYANRGWPVFPLHSPTTNAPCDCHKNCGRDAGKHPRTTHGVLDATTNVETVARWWRMWRTANIGIAAGRRSGLVVLDVDPRSGGDRSLADLVAEHGALPETPTVWTGGGGVHYYFAATGSIVKNSVSSLAPGLDIRGDGGYVVAPPSTHSSGQPYVWATACEPAPVPRWLEARLMKVSPATPRIDVQDVLSGVPEGQRDDTLFRLACKLRRVDIPRDVAEDIMLRAAAACVPPFPADEARRKVASAYHRYEPSVTAASPTRATKLVNLR